MKVGDLVYLDSKQFYEHDENLGIIIDAIESPDGILFLIAWDSNETGWFHKTELELINWR